MQRWTLAIRLTSTPAADLVQGNWLDFERCHTVAARCAPKGLVAKARTTVSPGLRRFGHDHETLVRRANPSGAWSMGVAEQMVPKVRATGIGLSVGAVE